MKFIILFLFLFLIFSCKKEKISIDPTPFEFKEFNIPDTIKTNNTITIIAKATGDELKYFWNSSGGLIIGAGSTIGWSSKKKGKFLIKCVVKNVNGSSFKKEKKITVIN